jgi:hypothetical protein
MQKAKGNLPEICAQARRIFGVTDTGNDNHQALKVNPEVRTRVGLESESESDSESNSSESDSERESNADHEVHEDRGEDSDNREADRNSDIDYHNNDADDGNGHDDSGPSRSENGVVDSLDHGLDAEKNDRGEESEEVVDPGPSRRQGRRDTKSWI